MVSIYATRSLQCRRFPCVQEFSVFVRDQVELLPFCLRESERGGVGAGGGLPLFKAGVNMNRSEI